MQPKSVQGLPFFTWNMLDFEHALAFSIEITTQARVAVIVTIRGFTKEGYFEYNHTTTNDSTPDVEQFRIPDFPIFLSVNCADLAGLQGDIWASVRMVINGDVFMTLCSGMVYFGKQISYPNIVNDDMRPGGGRIIDVVSSDPAAGVEESLTIPTGHMWRIIAASFTLVAAASAANRSVHMVFTTPNGVVIDTYPDIDQIISETKRYSFAHYGEGGGRSDNNVILATIPEYLILPPASTITTVTSGLQAGDNFSAMALLVEQWFAPTT